MSDDATPKRKTPTERAHELALAVAQKPAVEAQERIGVACDEGLYSWHVGAVRGADETLDDALERMSRVARELHERFPSLPKVVANPTRNAKGDVQLDVKGTVPHALDTFREHVEAFPLSRAQNFGRDYLPNEKTAAKRGEAAS